MSDMSREITRISSARMTAFERLRLIVNLQTRGVTGPEVLRVPRWLFEQFRAELEAWSAESRMKMADELRFQGMRVIPVDPGEWR